MVSAEHEPLSGRVALVTGASSGLGRRFASVLAATGATVVACARRLDRLEELAATDSRIVPVRCDVGSGEDREQLVETIAERFDRIDVCVNNAGVARGGPAETEPIEEFREVMGINVEAVFALTQMVGARMLAREAGSIINISSIFGLVAAGPVPEASYVASKSAINGLTRELAAQWASRGVRVNAIAPGWFRTEMNGELLDDERSRKWLERNCPMGRVGQPEELDGVLLFLAGDGSSYCTGQVIAIDGGWTAR